MRYFVIIGDKELRLKLRIMYEKYCTIILFSIGYKQKWCGNYINRSGVVII